LPTAELVSSDRWAGGTRVAGVPAGSGDAAGSAGHGAVLGTQDPAPLSSGRGEMAVPVCCSEREVGRRARGSSSRCRAR